MSADEDAYQRSIITARRYHSGEQGAQITDRLREFLPSVSLGEEFRLNICRVIISAMTDRMRIVGFDSPNTNKIEWASEIWDDNRGPIVELDLYETLLRDGEAFVILDVDLDTVPPSMSWHVNQRYTSVDVEGDGVGCRAFYENDDPNQRLLAVTKDWVLIDEQSRVVRYRNIYTKDRVIKQKHNGHAWVQREPEIDWTDSTGEPLGVAAVHFYNKGFKREAEDVFTLQDAVNKTFLDMLASSDISAFRIYVALGWIPTVDGKEPEEDGSNWMPVEPGRIIGTDKPKTEVSLDSIEPTDPETIIKAVQQCILWASMVSSTPASRFISTKLIASDETLKQQEEPLVAKIDGVKTLVSYSWRQLFLLSERVWNAITTPVVAEGKLKPIWCHSASLESLMTILKDKKTLGIPQRQLWREMGYDEKKIASMEADATKAMKDAQALIASNTPEEDEEGVSDDAQDQEN